MREPRYESFRFDNLDARRIVSLGLIRIRHAKRARAKAERRWAQECIRGGADELAANKLRARGWIA